MDMNRQFHLVMFWDEGGYKSLTMAVPSEIISKMQSDINDVNENLPADCSIKAELLIDDFILFDKNDKDITYRDDVYASWRQDRPRIIFSNKDNGRIFFFDGAEVNLFNQKYYTDDFVTQRPTISSYFTLAGEKLVVED